MKRGRVGNQLSLFSFLLLLLIVGGGIVGGIALYYGAGTDYRSQESAFIASLIERCFLRGVFNETLASCGLDTRLSQQNRYQIAVCEGVCFIASPQYVLYHGDSPETCRLITKDSATYPKCVERAFTFQGKAYQIVVGTNYRGRTV